MNAHPSVPIVAARTLLIAAHPDDEVLGAGGVIAGLTARSQPVAIAILGEGITSRSDRREQADRRMVEALAGKARKAAACLGVKDVSLFELPDNRFDTVPLLDVVKIVEGLIERHRPQVIYTHHGGDLNFDHTIVHRAVLTACRPVGNCPVREIYAFEVPSSTEWAFSQLSPAFRPNVFVDISTTLEAKIEAMQTYESEAREFPHPRSPMALRAIAARWGSVAGCPAAEAFELIRAIR
jgi:LmbE family N-acetylglucosaminyl deacetylase